MDDLAKLLQESSRRNRIAYQNKQVAQQKQRDRQTPHATKLDYDASIGLDRVELSNGSIIYAQPVTNGAIGVGDSVELHRGGSARIDQMPHQKRVVAKQAKPQPQLGKIKILYSTSELDENGFVTHINLWIAGDGRTKPHQVFRYAASDFFLTGINLCNTGPKLDDWIVSYTIIDRKTNAHLVKIVSPQSQISHPSSAEPIGQYVGGGFYTFLVGSVAIRETYRIDTQSADNTSSSGGYTTISEYQNGALVSSNTTGDGLQDGKYTFTNSSSGTYGIESSQSKFASASGTHQRSGAGYGYYYSTDSGGIDGTQTYTKSANATFFSSAFSLFKGLQKGEGSQTESQNSFSHIISLREEMDGGPNFLNDSNSSSLERSQGVVLLSPYLSQETFYESKQEQSTLSSESTDTQKSESSTKNYNANPMISSSTGRTALVAILDRESYSQTSRNGDSPTSTNTGSNRDAYYLYSYSNEGIVKTKIIEADYYNIPLNIKDRFGGIDYSRINLVGSKIYCTPLDFQVRTKDFDLETETIALQEGGYITSTKKVKIYNLRAPNANLIAFSGYEI